MKKQNTLLLWIVLWVGGFLFITIKNRIVQGAELSLGSIITANLIMDLFLVPIAVIGYFVIKFLAKAVGASDFWEGNNARRNVLLTWLVLFILVFLFPLFKK